MARPTDYTDELAQEICERLEEGTSLYRVCQAEDMPARSTVHLWLDAHSEFSDRYARAKMLAAEKRADECVEIADEAQHAENSVEVQAAKLRIDARQWYTKVTEPKKYGNKIDIDQKTEHSGQVQMNYTDACALLREHGINPDEID